MPIKEIGHIRPSVFKVASLMASGRRFSLDVHVLTSIYNGLNKIVHSTSLKDCRAMFPIHYVYAWIAQYFNTHYNHASFNLVARMTKFRGEKMAKYFNIPEAQSIFQHVDPSLLDNHSAAHDGERTLTDDGTLSSTWSDYFISLRSSFLTLRHASIYLIEPYSPHRFCRQFGFG